MTVLIAVLAGVLFGGGTYLLMQRTLTRIVLGLLLWGHAVNLILLGAGGRSGEAPIVDDGPLDPTAHADPLAQALVLTAIVITFAIVIFLLTLAYRSWTLTGGDIAEDDLEDRRIAEHSYRSELEVLDDGTEPDHEEVG